MKKAFILLLLCIGTISLMGQKQDFTLDQLKAPTMPAATIISSQINEISRPKSFKDLEAALLNNYLDSTNSLSIPNNFALEGNPYLLSKRPNFDYKEYLENKFADNLWKDFSFSLASTTNFVLNDSVNTNAFGLGLRTTLLRGNVNKEVKDAYEKALAFQLGNKIIPGEVRNAIDYYRGQTQLSENYSVENLYKWLMEIYQTIVNHLRRIIWWN